MNSSLNFNLDKRGQKTEVIFGSEIRRD